MARLNQKLSIVIPTINEASRLPLLLADLNKWSDQLEICICDARSTDLTTLVAELAGAMVTPAIEANRGVQLHSGALSTSGNWLLFLHADCRMPKNWLEVISKKIDNSSSKNYAWFFEFKVRNNHIRFNLLELAVYLRSNLLKRPYGDQGLLISRDFYNEIGGYRPFHIMEDLDLIERILRQGKVKSLGIPLYINDRRWANMSIVVQAFKNAYLRKRWRSGEETKNLAMEYYKK